MDEASTEVARSMEEEALRCRADTQRVLNEILRASLRDEPVESVLECALEELLSVEWLSFERRGCVFVVEPDEPDALKMRAWHGLVPEIVDRCGHVDFGVCHCGRAAASREMVFADGVDERHEIDMGETDHGHYCAPMVLGDEVLGVVNLYVRPGHERSEVEEDLIGAVADVLAGVLDRDRARRELAESRGVLSAIVEAFDGLLYMCASDYRIEYMNERFQQLLGCDPTGQLCYRAIHGLDEECPWCTNPRVFGGETVRWELRLEKDGRHYMVVNRPIVHPDGSLSKVSLATDITERKLAELDLRHSMEEVEEALDGVVQALAGTTSQRDPYTAVHQERVARLGMAIARDMGLDDDFVEGLRIAGLLHDIGKIAVPTGILSKPGKLTDMEMGIVRTHASVGHALLEHVPFKGPVAQAVLQHHERLDGSGYPDALCADELLLEAKILAVADVVEAISSHRPYRPALGIEAAVEEVSSRTGTLFDREVVESCVRVVRSGSFEL